MLLGYLYDPALAHASYIVGCQQTGEAIVIDPGRDVEPYLEVAASEKMNIIGTADPHIHADYVSGAGELAERVGAKLFVSDEGPAEWKYEYADQYDHRLLKKADKFTAGRIGFQVMLTPGHTPESLSFILTDKGGGADNPMGIFTGDSEIIDVRGITEREEMSIPGSEYCFLGKMMDQVDRFQGDKTDVFQCRTGGRSMIAASIAERAGTRHVVNLQGGIQPWKAAGLPVEVAGHQIAAAT